MLLKQMRYFVTIVDCNSFTEAAEQLFISQSAISQQIKVLESELGVELIRRENRRFSLTPAGEYFYRQSRGILEEIEEIRRETVRLGADKELQLRIGYLRSYGGQELHRAVAEFTRIYPEVSIYISQGTHEELYDLLRVGELDLVLNDQRRAFSDAYVNMELWKCSCYAELSVRHTLSGQAAVTMEELKRTPCILISSREQRGAEQDYYEKTLGFGSSFLFAENLEEGRLMVAGNRGFLPVESADAHLPDSVGIRRLPILRGGEALTRKICVFWQKERTNYYIEEFAEILHRFFGGKI